jgi:hypothetical protein
MNDWVITKVSPPPPEHPQASQWPTCATYTVENTSTHEVRKVTCCGQGCIEQMIVDRRFDPDVEAEGLRRASADDAKVESLK